MSLTVLHAGVAGGVALAVFLAFVGARFVVRALTRRRGPREEPLIADRLAEHLEAVGPPRRLGDRLDRVLERLAGRSSLQMTGAQAGGTCCSRGRRPARRCTCGWAGRRRRWAAPGVLRCSRWGSSGSCTGAGGGRSRSCCRTPSTCWRGRCGPD